MTEQEWLACIDPYAMSEWLYNSQNTDRRKLGLFFAACCSRIQPSSAEERSRRAVYGLWLANTYDQDADWITPAYGPVALTNARFHILCAVQEAVFAIGGGTGEHAVLANLLRDIIGPLPFRSVAIEPSCVTPAVLAIAQAIYNERSFDRMSNLADALEEAGCTDPDILSHCRAAGPHVKGCWVVDLLLGKD